jgi:alanine racemase
MSAPRAFPAEAQWIEIRAAALRSNLSLFRGLIGEDTQLAAVVKANAYGHGLELVAPVAAPYVDWFAVHRADEARAIRDLGLEHPVLVMGFVTAADCRFLDERTHVLVSCPEVVECLAGHRRAGGVSVPIHLKVDTGTNRQGVSPVELPALCEAARQHELRVVGVATHFANIEDTLEHDFARRQLDVFRDALGVVHGLGIEPRWVHAGCSAAALLFRDADFTLTRVGISMYGHWPSRETRLSWTMSRGRGRLQLEPVLSWKTVVGQIQEVAAGETVGYGRTWTALRPTRLAVLPIGYSDGYPRRLGSRSRVIVGGRLVPVVGRVCMNITLVDITDLPETRVGDEVVIVGRDDEVEVSAEEVAALAGTINYELLARLAPHIPRHLV